MTIESLLSVFFVVHDSRTFAKRTFCCMHSEPDTDTGTVQCDSYGCGMTGTLNKAVPVSLLSKSGFTLAVRVLIT